MDHSLLNEVADFVERGSRNGRAVLAVHERASRLSFEYIGVAVVDGAALTVTATVNDAGKRLTGASITLDLDALRDITIGSGDVCSFDHELYEGTLTFDGDR